MKVSFTTLAAVAALTLGGAALAQSTDTTANTNATPKTSTPGAGCTATGNAMSAGNLGGSPSNKECGNNARSATTAATPAAPAATAGTVAATPVTPAPADTGATASTSTSDTSAAATSSSTRTTRVARADRG